jgi:hypothetical protein
LHLHSFLFSFSTKKGKSIAPMVGLLLMKPTSTTVDSAHDEYGARHCRRRNLRAAQVFSVLLSVGSAPIQSISHRPEEVVGVSVRRSVCVRISATAVGTAANQMSFLFVSFFLCYVSANLFLLVESVHVIW